MRTGTGLRAGCRGVKPRNLCRRIAGVYGRPVRAARLSWVVFPVYLAVVVVLVAWIAEWRFVEAVRPAAFAPDVVIAGIDPELASQLGPLRNPAERPSSFANVPRAKPPGTLRIGAFGDSFTWGSEVSSGNDYPALLGERARALGHADVETLNFGNPGFGMHQSVLMWERVGQDYGLDAVVVLALAKLWVPRDTSFTFWDPPAEKLGFHARWVLDGDDDVRLVTVLGTTEAERFDAYMRFVPHARYARYDRKPPAFLRAWLPAGRTLRNPFYYRRGELADEAFATYRTLLRRVGTEAKRVVVADLSGADLDDLDVPGVQRVRVPATSAFPYLAPQSHLGPWGNRLIADSVAAALGLGGSVRHVELEPGDITGDGPAMGLADADDVDVTLDDVPTGGLYVYRRHDPFAQERVDRLADGAQALAAVPLSGATLADALWLPLARAEVPEVRIEGGDGLVPLAVHAASLGAADLVRLDLCGSAALRDALGVAADAPCVTVEHAAAERPAGRALALHVGGTPLVTAVAAADGRLFLDPTSRFYRLRTDGEVRPDPDALPESGRVLLAVGAKRIPLARFRVVDVPLAQITENASMTWAAK